MLQLFPRWGLWTDMCGGWGVCVWVLCATARGSYVQEAALTDSVGMLMMWEY